MARQRTRATELARLLHEAARPVYVLDDERTVVFCNEACLAWLGRSDEEILGQTCAYHSTAKPGTVAAAVDGLCGPPGIEEGRPTTAIVAAADPAGRLRRRRARFVPLSFDAGPTIALVVLVDSDDLPEDETPPELDAAPSNEPRADAMHDRIRRFRAAAAGRCRVDRLAGDSPPMRLARAQAELAAGCRANVAIVGPPGSGRRHVASAIHYASDPGGEGSLIPLDCSMLGSELIRSTVSTLLSGALGTRTTRSTLLLNEADRLPRDVQGELAAALLGRRPSLRVIATARRSLGRMARRGRFYPSLAAGLETITIALPPVARRREDVPLLAQMLLEDVNAQGAKQLAGFTAEALACLDAYAWPGNVDEMALLIAEAHQRAEGPEIRPADLPKRIHLAAEAAAHPPPRVETIQLDRFLGEIERELIERALTQAKGNKARAARLLGVTRPRLYRRLVQLGLE
ncbi:MAG: sigma 54-interacting transcriptional regulator [Pirellulales bacterium]|nr:sigma 54-interacting transcriptional regulator [Pirellulales bacterium]